MTKHWHKINKGDTACIIAPSYGEAEMADVVPAEAKAVSIVESYGLNAFMYPNAIFPGNHTLFDNVHLRFANTDEIAITQLMNAFNNPICKVIWAYRGGYRAISLLSNLSKELEPQIVKPFIGFSDATILHSFINNVWGWPSIHFGMPGALAEVMQREDTKESLQNVLFNPQKQVSFTLQALNKDSSDYSVIKGITAGGNMYNFDKLLGTKFSPVLDDSIIILEDVGEPARKIAGCLEKLKIMPDFDKISAVIFATFTPAKEQEIFNRVFEDFAHNTNVAVFKLDPQDTIGHGDINKALPLGLEATITLDGEYFHLHVDKGSYMFDNSEL